MLRRSHRVGRVTAGLLAAAWVLASALGSQIVLAQERSNPAVSISPVPMVHVLQPAAAPRGAAPAPARVEQAATPVAGAVSAGLHIQPTFDVSITGDSNAAAIEAAINAAIASIESQFSDQITVNITFQKMGQGLGGSSTYFANLPYATFLNALKADARTSDDATAAALLANVASNPVNFDTTINVKTANLKAVGITPPSTPADGFIYVNTMLTSPGSSGSSLQYSLVAVVEHEINEVLGLGSSLPDIYNGTIFPEDLYRYDASGQRTFATTDSRAGGVRAYFSIDANSVPLAEFDNQNDGGDFGDWQSNPLRSGVAAKVQDAFATPGANPALGPELVALDVIGYDRVGRGARRAQGDFDGDARSDLAVYRPVSGAWYILKSSANFGAGVAYGWGVSTDIPVPGDYDGDGKTDIAVYRPVSGAWYILKSSANFGVGVAYGWGASTDVPVPGDYDGDGKSDLAVYRPASGRWYILKSSTNFAASATYSWGVGTDIPVPGDYDGDGKTDIAVYRPSSGAWYILKSSANFGSGVAYGWGVSTDIPVPGDYDGDGKTDVAVYRPSSGTWYILKSSANFGAGASYAWGASTDIPVPGDYDGDGRADLAFYHPPTGVWYILKSTSNYGASMVYQWGIATDVPVLK